MIKIFAAARELQDFCDEMGWRSCFIGGVAVQRWSEASVTRDVDLTLLTGFGREDFYIDALSARSPLKNSPSLTPRRTSMRPA